MQVCTAHSDARLQLLDPPDRALCTDRRAPALAPPVHCGDEPYTPAATPLPVWLPQQCPHDCPQPSLLHDPGRLAITAGMLISHFVAAVVCNACHSLLLHVCMLISVC